MENFFTKEFMLLFFSMLCFITGLIFILFLIVEVNFLQKISIENRLYATALGINLILVGSVVYSSLSEVELEEQQRMQSERVVLASQMPIQQAEEEEEERRRRVAEIEAQIRAKVIEEQRKAESASSERNATSVDEILDSLISASIIYNSFNEINLNESKVIHLVLGEEISKLEKIILSDEGEKHSANIKISKEMEATLTGQGFDISVIGKEIQPISLKTPTEWKWEVKAKEPGVKYLHLVISAFVEINGKQLQKPIKTFDREIVVKVNWIEKTQSFVEENWQGLWTVILIPVLGFTWNYWKNNSKKMIRLLTCL